MTNQQQHPITPPPELVQLWFEQHYAYNKGLNELLTEVAQWGADAELEACCQALRVRGTRMRCMEANQTIEHLRAARRPKPPSLKEQAIAVLEDAELDAAHYNILLRALEALPDD